MTNTVILLGRFLGICLFVILSCLPTILPAQSQQQLKQQLRFNNFNHIHNMPNQEIFCITKDQMGFIWIGSTDGLYKLDATNTIQTYKKNQPNIEGGIASSAIRSLYSDSKNNLWIGTVGGGLTKYHQPTNEWTTYQTNDSDEHSISNNDILSILEDSQGRIWIGTEYGLNLYQADTESFVRFLPNKKDATAISNRAIVSILEDHQQRLWFSTWAGGVNLLLPHESGSIADSQFRRINPSEDEVTQNVWKIYQDKQHRYWLGTTGGGLFLMQLPEEATDETSKQDWKPAFTQFKNDKKDPYSLSSNIIFDVLEDAFGFLWVATRNGLNRINMHTLIDPTTNNLFEHYFPSIYNQRAINAERIHTIYMDNQDIVWFGTTNGVSQYNWYNNQFDNYLLFNNLQGNDNILDIETSQYTIWAGSNNQGLFSVNTKNGQLSTYRFGLLENSISSLYLHSEEELYIGTTKGVQKLNPITLDYEDYPIPPDLLKKNSYFEIVNILKDKKDRIWLATMIGLFQLDEQTGNYKAFYHDPYNPNSISDNTVNDIYEDSKGNLWIATFNGLNKINLYRPGKLFFKKYYNDKDAPNSVPSNNLTVIKEIQDQLFIGSRHGLFIYDYQQDHFMDLNKNANRYFIRSLEESIDHQLWGSTPTSIFHYDIQQQSFRHYDSQDDLGGATYIPTASSVDQQGYIYFALNTGVTRFIPSEIIKNKEPAPIVLTGIKTISTTGEHIASNPYMKTIGLTPEDYHLTINFAIQNFINPKQNQYAYKLEGFDKDWNHTSTDISATYTNLSHGDYTFKVKAANNDNVWNEKNLAVKLKKYPAIWETYWFRGLLLVATLLLGWLSVVLYTKNVHKKNKRLSSFNASLNQEIDERKKVEAELHKREHFMDQLVKERTQQLEVKNEEVHSLLFKIQNRNEELEDIVTQRTKELKDYNKELKRSNSDLEQFAYIASHDLQAPLRTIKSFSGLLEKSLANKLNTREEDFLGFITSGVSSMQELVGSLLTFSRVNARSTKLVAINLPQLIEQIQLEINSLIQESKAEVICSDLPINIIGDKIKIKQLFQNLITNAIKFTAPETTPVIKIQGSGTVNHWQFKVIDNGIGIDPNFQEKIFQLFQRLHTKEEYEGTGIGLALCKKIVEQHKGTIEVQSEKGKGSCFIFSIHKQLVGEEKAIMV